ncbi:hypothetical protein EYF80_021552 [Liparis tanakae]|uniref:Uncharacterized protein n=1 Tax=Liparis tanakae TaxID=230148 RepID=A0A4Z2HRI8_9TELE|nr:hypothetical protein EYF80_021552 [Liparis tanakae]
MKKLGQERIGTFRRVVTFRTGRRPLAPRPPSSREIRCPTERHNGRTVLPPAALFSPEPDGHNEALIHTEPGPAVSLTDISKVDHRREKQLEHEVKDTFRCPMKTKPICLLGRMSERLVNPLC